MSDPIIVAMADDARLESVPFMKLKRFVGAADVGGRSAELKSAIGNVASKMAVLRLADDFGISLEPLLSQVGEPSATSIAETPQRISSPPPQPQRAAPPRPTGPAATFAAPAAGSASNAGAIKSSPRLLAKGRQEAGIYKFDDPVCTYVEHKRGTVTVQMQHDSSRQFDGLRPESILPLRFADGDRIQLKAGMAVVAGFHGPGARYAVRMEGVPLPAAWRWVPAASQLTLRAAADGDSADAAPKQLVEPPASDEGIATALEVAACIGPDACCMYNTGLVKSRPRLFSSVDCLCAALSHMDALPQLREASALEEMKQAPIWERGQDVEVLALLLKLFGPAGTDGAPPYVASPVTAVKRNEWPKFNIYSILPKVQAH